ncbi:ATP-dependent RNA helicase [Mycena kentingensis (nom. inval.)]|nr:ATP-dependent RNA helicase [Mycena kentingensis (nom. inval.)]
MASSFEISPLRRLLSVIKSRASSIATTSARSSSCPTTATAESREQSEWDLNHIAIAAVESFGSLLLDPTIVSGANISVTGQSGVGFYLVGERVQVICKRNDNEYTSIGVGRWWHIHHYPRHRQHINRATEICLCLRPARLPRGEEDPRDRSSTHQAEEGGQEGARDDDEEAAEDKPKIEEVEDEDDAPKVKRVKEQETTTEELNKTKPIWTRNPSRRTARFTRALPTTRRINPPSSTFPSRVNSSSRLSSSSLNDAHTDLFEPRKMKGNNTKLYFIADNCGRLDALEYAAFHDPHRLVEDMINYHQCSTPEPHRRPMSCSSQGCLPSPPECLNKYVSVLAHPPTLEDVDIVLERALLIVESVHLSCMNANVLEWMSYLPALKVLRVDKERWMAQPSDEAEFIKQAEVMFASLPNPLKLATPRLFRSPEALLKDAQDNCDQYRKPSEIISTLSLTIQDRDGRRLKLSFKETDTPSLANQPYVVLRHNPEAMEPFSLDSVPSPADVHREIEDKLSLPKPFLPRHWLPTYQLHTFNSPDSSAGTASFRRHWKPEISIPSLLSVSVVRTGLNGRVIGHVEVHSSRVDWRIFSENAASGLKTIAPGFTRGLLLSRQVDESLVDLSTDLEPGEDDFAAEADAFFDEQLEAPTRTLEMTSTISSPPLCRSYLKPVKAATRRAPKRIVPKRDWAHVIDANTPLSNFHELVPEMVHKLRHPAPTPSKATANAEFVIFDDVHYVNDAEARSLLLSATVPNESEELADWVGRAKKKDVYMIATAQRPGPLERYLYAGRETYKIVDSSCNFIQGSGRRASEATRSVKRLVYHLYNGLAHTEHQLGNAVNSEASVGLLLPLGDAAQGVATTHRGTLGKGLPPVVVFTFSKKRREVIAGTRKSKFLSCDVCQPDISRFYDDSFTIVAANQRLLTMAVGHPPRRELLSSGRVVFLRDLVSVLLKPAPVVASDSGLREKLRTYLVLTLVNEETKRQRRGTLLNTITPRWPLQPHSLIVDNAVYEVTAVPLYSIAMIAGRMRSLELQETLRSQNSLVEELASRACCCARVSRAATRFFTERKVLRANIANSKISDQNIELIPDFEQRIDVLQALKFIDENSTVLLERRVAYETNCVKEFVLTELILEHPFSKLRAGGDHHAPVFCPPRKDRDRARYPSQTRGREGSHPRDKRPRWTFQDLHKVTTEDFPSNLKFGLVEVVYEWAKGMHLLAMKPPSVHRVHRRGRLIQRVHLLLPLLKQSSSSSTVALGERELLIRLKRLLIPTLTPSAAVSPNFYGTVLREGIYDIDLFLKSLPSYRDGFIAAGFGEHESYIHAGSLTTRAATRLWTSCRAKICETTSGRFTASADNILAHRTVGRLTRLRPTLCRLLLLLGSRAPDAEGSMALTRRRILRPVATTGWMGLQDRHIAGKMEREHRARAADAGLEEPESDSDEELIPQGCDYQLDDPVLRSNTMRLEDDEGRGFGMLAGAPSDASWSENVAEPAAATMEQALSELYGDATSAPTKRRGTHFAETVGAGMGGGRCEPTALYHQLPTEVLL